MVKNIYQNLPTDEKIKLYLRFCDYLTKERAVTEKAVRQAASRTETTNSTQTTNPQNQTANLENDTSESKPSSHHAGKPEINRIGALLR